MLDRLLFKYIGNAKKYIAVSVFLMMLKVAGSFLIALSLGKIIQGLFLAASLDAGNIFLFLMGFLLRSGSLYLVTRYQTKITGEVKTNLRTEMIEKAMRIGPAYLNHTSTANMINMGSDTIEQVLVTAINQTLCDKDSFLITLRDNIATVINRESDKALSDIDKRLEELQNELLKLATSNADYDKVGDEIHHLRDQKQKLLLESANRDELKKRIADMSTFLKKQFTALTKYDEQLVRRLIEKVTVYEDKFTVEFKSGVTVDVEE